MKREQQTYAERWYLVSLSLIRERGRAGTIGFLIGILARLTRNDYDLRRVLAQLEDRLDD